MRAVLLARLHALPRPVRLGIGAATLVAAGVLGAASAGPPRFTLLNTAIVIDYPWARGISALGCALTFALFAETLVRTALRRSLLVIALLPAAVGWHLLRYRLEAAPAGLTSRGAVRSTTLPWSAVIKARVGSESVEVVGDGVTIGVDTADFSPDQRAALARTITRRVREAGTGSVLTVPD